ncbi:DUF2848 domain-containing protein [Leisingera sp. D0M16]|uniref:DUF2848 domain-containing protein n=1 Tax=Leisingera coralii TaxID=3351347 RepID=UPI003B78A7C0
MASLTSSWAEDIDHLTIAGWTGRDPDAVQHHIDELAELGVAPPSQVPLFYRVSRSLVTHADEIEVLGTANSGEAEPVLVNRDGTLWLGLGSDHTDRELEAISVAGGKQACPKPVATGLWHFDEIEARQDEILLRCHVEEDGAWVPYQDGTLAAIRPLRSLVEQTGLETGGAMFCGTLAAIGPVRPAKAYRMELIDSRPDRSIRLEYRVRTLPVVE